MVCLSMIIPFDSFEIVIVKGTMDLPAIGTGGTLCFQGAGVTAGSIGLVFRLLCFVLHPSQVQCLTIGADIAVLGCIVGEFGRAVIRHMLIVSIEERIESSH